MLTCLSHERLWYFIVNMVLYSSEKDFFDTNSSPFFQPWEKGKTGYLDETAYEKNTTEVEGS